MRHAGVPQTRRRLSTHHTKNRYMYTQKKSSTKQAMPVFMLKGDIDPSPTFVAGRCECKTCKSTELDFYKYLADAKCSDCGQWQNEEPIPE